MAGDSTPGGPFSGAVLQWVEEQSSQGLFTTDRDLVIQTWNRWMALATGLPASRVIGLPLFDVVPSLVERGLDSHYRDALSGQVKVLSQTLHRYLVPSSRPSGDNMPQTARIAPLSFGGEIVGTITVIEDVSDRLITEAQLRAQLVSWKKLAPRPRTRRGPRMISWPLSRTRFARR
jgi:PAS domain S-box-containing protein